MPLEVENGYKVPYVDVVVLVLAVLPGNEEKI
jgi:hypothetical protein